MTDWDQHATTWDQDEAARAYAQAAFGSLSAVMAASGHSLEGARVCDFGCGTGLLTERLADNSERVDAVDTSRAMLDVLRSKIERHGWRNVWPASELTSVLANQDLVVCSSVCAFLDDYPGTVGQLVARLRPGGLFVQWDWKRDDHDPESHGLSRDEIRAVLTGAGLSSVSVDTAFDLSVDGQTMKPLIGFGQRLTPR